MTNSNKVCLSARLQPFSRPVSELRSYCIVHVCVLMGHLESGVYGGGPLTLSLPVLAQALQMLRSTENTRRPLQGSTAGQTLGPLHLWPYLRHWHCL